MPDVSSKIEPVSQSPVAKPATVEATFRNGSLTAVSVIVGFSLSFIKGWAAIPGVWTGSDIAALSAIVGGIVLQLAAVAMLLSVGSLALARYNRAITIFLVGLGLVAVGVGLAILGDIVGYGQNVLGK